MSSAPAGRCLNCSALLTGPFCASCGQKEARIDLSVRGLLRETTQELTSLDGKVPATLTTLFCRPGRLTTDFFAGRRARWLSPLRVYLICSIAFFAAKPIVSAVTGRSPREIAQFTLTSGGPPRPLTDDEKRRIAEGLPGRVLGADRLVRAATDSARLNREIDAAFPQAMFILLPIFALLTWVAWRRAAPAYPMHLYVALHLHAVLFGILTVVTIAGGLFRSQAVVMVIVAALLLYLAVHGLTVLRRVFGESWARTIVKALLIIPVYLLCLLTAAIALVGLAVSRM